MSMHSLRSTSLEIKSHFFELAGLQNGSQFLKVRTTKLPGIHMQIFLYVVQVSSNANLDCDNCGRAQVPNSQAV